MIPEGENKSTVVGKVGESTPVADNARFTTSNTPNEDTLMPDVLSTDAQEIQESDEDSLDSEYHSFSDSDADSDVKDGVSKQIEADRQARALERRMVLEAAGLVVKREEGRRPPPRPQRRNAALVSPLKERKHRPPPAIPQRAYEGQGNEDQGDEEELGGDKELPSLPRDTSLRIDDAFERYEAFKLQAASESNRFSVASFDSNGGNNVPPSPTSPTSHFRVPSRAENRDSSTTSSLNPGGILSHLLGRSKTPVNEGEQRSRPVISGPISAPMSMTNSDVHGEGARSTSPSAGATRTESETTSVGGVGFGLVGCCFNLLMIDLK
jgi:actin cytoskeleton-regulatory complex protein PAN1